MTKLTKIKKAVSPLIATILLIVVAVVLITIVLSWGKSFTQSGLDKTGAITNDSCQGAAISISGCKIASDSNIEFFVTNISSSYSFLSTDTFQVDMVDNSNNVDRSIDMYTTTTWAGLAPGETIKAEMDPTNATGTYVDITVKSSVCPTDAINTFYDCHK